MTGDVLLSAEALVCGYDGRGLLPSLDVSIRAGQRWALVGRNGAGKTTVLRTILGLLPPVSGRVARRDGLSISYLAQRHEVARLACERLFIPLRCGQHVLHEPRLRPARW